MKFSYPASGMILTTPANITDEMEDALEEVRNLHHLLDGYNSILYRYEERSNEGRHLDNFQSNSGRPDRVRSKYSTNEAIEKLHNVDDIFPIYQNYFNVSEATDSSSLKEILSERVRNIKSTLEKLEEVYPQNKSVKSGISLILLALIIASGFNALQSQL